MHLGNGDALDGNEGLTDYPYCHVAAVLILKGEVVVSERCDLLRVGQVSHSYHRLHSSDYKDGSPQSCSPKTHSGFDRVGSQ